ncbi:ceramide kinase-like [Styela clava]
MSSHDYGVENFILNSSICNVSIEDNVLVINFLPDGNTDKNNSAKPRKLISFSEILSVKFTQPENLTEKKRGLNFIKKTKVFCVEIKTVKKCKDYRWKLTTVKLKSANDGFCKYWVDIFNKKLSKISDCRPKTLLVFVNPFGGNGEGVNIYEKKVKPIFGEAKIKTETKQTAFRHHAKTFIETKDLSVYDGIVAVGGDGMCNEIINGLLCRTQFQQGVGIHSEKGNPRQCPKFVRPDLRVGIIPAGSTDCISYVTQGINDPETSALHIALGDSHPVDVVSLHNSDGLLAQFSMSLNGYGYFGDMMRQSEHLRWMGPPRYSLAGANVFLKNKSYSGEVHYVPAECKEGPKSLSFCRTPCEICQDGLADKKSSLFTPVTPSSSFIDAEQKGLTFDCDGENEIPDESAIDDTLNNKEKVTEHDVCCDEESTLPGTSDLLDSGIQEDMTETKKNESAIFIKLESMTHEKVADGLNDDNEISAQVTELEGHRDAAIEDEHNIVENGKDLFMTQKLDCDAIKSISTRPISLELKNSTVFEDKEEWKIIQGDFMAVNGVSMSCACERAPLGISPYSHLSDGALDLILVRSCSRFDFLRYLAVHAGRGDRFDFPFIEVHRVKAFQFIPSVTPTQAVIENAYSPPNSPHEVSSGGESIHISLEELSVRYNRKSGKKKKNRRRSMNRTQSEAANMQSTWNSDGEIVTDPNMTVRVHRGLILMFCRGIEG